MALSATARHPAPPRASGSLSPRWANLAHPSEARADGTPRRAPHDDQQRKRSASSSRACTWSARPRSSIVPGRGGGRFRPGWWAWSSAHANRALAPPHARPAAASGTRSNPSASAMWTAAGERFLTATARSGTSQAPLTHKAAGALLAGIRRRRPRPCGHRASSGRRLRLLMLTGRVPVHDPRPRRPRRRAHQTSATAMLRVRSRRESLS